jgi:putative transposase
MGRKAHVWQDLDTVLNRFGSNVRSARKKYWEFVMEGVGIGKRNDLTGGGLIRSSGGWQALKDLRKQGIQLKSDERILGDSDFVESVLKGQEEHFNRRYRLLSNGYAFDKVVVRVAELLKMNPGVILQPSKKPKRVQARSLVCFWAVTELGLSGTEVGKRLGIVQSAVSKAVERGANLAADHHLNIEDDRNR